MTEVDPRVPEEPGAPSPLDVRRCAVWQAIWVAAACGGSILLGRGSPVSVVAGAAVLFASFALQRLAVRAALREDRRRGTAIGFFLLKLALLIGVVAVGLETALISPMSFAAGVTTLPLAIVSEACYRTWLARARAA